MNKEKARILKEKLNAFASKGGRQEAGDFLATFFESMMSGKELTNAVNDLKSLKKDERDNFLMLLDEIRRLKPQELKELDVYVKNHPKYPTEVTVKNLEDLKFPKSFDLNKPKWWVEQKDFSPALYAAGKAIVQALEKQANKISTVMIDNKTPREAIPVRLVDKRGRDFYNAVMTAISGGVGEVSKTRWYAAINVANNGNNTIKAAVAGKKIVVTSVVLVSDGTVDVRWESGAGGTALSGQIPLQAREGYSAHDPDGLFETAVSTLLNLELSSAVNVHGHISGNLV